MDQDKGRDAKKILLVEDEEDIRKTVGYQLTAKGEDYDRIKGKVIGATTYKIKPFDWDDLLSTVRGCLKNS